MTVAHRLRARPAPPPGSHHAGQPRRVRAEGGYAGWRKALKKMTPEQVVEEVKAAGLRGRGGAGFPTGIKWSFIPKAPGAKYLAVNADESEPGTFKDREIIEIEPHRVLEGVALCCYAIGAETAFIYIRGEYVEPADRLEAAIAEAEAAGILGQGMPRHADQRARSTCFAAREHTSAVRRRRCSSRSKAVGRCRARGRRFRPSRACTADRRSSTTSRHWPTCPHIIDRGSAWYNSIGTPPQNTGPRSSASRAG